MEFVWEADYLENNCQILSNTLDDTETVDGNQSTDSSLSKVKNFIILKILNPCFRIPMKVLTQQLEINMRTLMKYLM